MKAWRVFPCLVLLGLTACHDTDNTGATGPNPPPASDPTPPVAATGTVKVTLTFPVAESSVPDAAARQGPTAKHAALRAQRTSYVSSKTQSVSVVLVAVNGASPATPVGASIDVKDGSSCVISGGNLNCTLSLAAPVGNDEFQVDTWPDTGGGGPLALSTGTGTAAVPANGNVSLAVELLPRIKEYDVEITPGPGVAPIGFPGVFTARIRGKDAAGDIITGTTDYHEPLMVTSNEIAGGHITASPALPVTFSSPAQDTITFTYDGGGIASSYAFNVSGSGSKNYYLTFLTSQEHLYVSQPAANEIDVYDIQADGSLTGPSRSIVGSHTGLNHPTSIAIDELGQLFVVNSNNLLIFAPGASGDTAPIRTDYVGAHPYYVSYRAGMILNHVIDPNDPQYPAATVNINYPAGILFSTDSGLPPSDILSFVDPAAGAVASWSVANGSGYLCETYVDAVDSNQNRVRCITMPISSLTTTGGLPSDYPNIQIYNGAANNSVTCCFVNTYDLKFLSDGRLLVSSGTSYNYAAALETYVLPSGNVIASIHGSDTLLEVPIAIAFDSHGNDYVLDAGLATGDGKVLEFAPDATGNVAPIHKLLGFTSPGGIAIGQ